MMMTKTKAFEKITKREFAAYERVRKSGKVNMWTRDVCVLAGIDDATHIAIIKHYNALRAKYPGVREGG